MEKNARIEEKECEWSTSDGMQTDIGSLNSDNFSTYGGETEIESHCIKKHAHSTANQRN